MSRAPFIGIVVYSAGLTVLAFNGALAYCISSFPALVALAVSARSIWKDMQA